MGKYIVRVVKTFLTIKRKEKFYVVDIFNSFLFVIGNGIIKIACKDTAIKDNKKIAYFKVNRCKSENLLCFQKWVDVFSKMEYGICIVCDSKKVRRKLLEKIEFHSDCFYFSKSRKIKLEHIVNNIYTDYWKNATFAHLFPFYNSVDKYMKHWDIDADDTMLCLDDDALVETFLKVEEIVNREGLDAASLDIWHSRTNGKHWSFGVTYVNNNQRIWDCIIRLKDCEWKKKYLHRDDSLNADWYFTFLRDEGLLLLESFCIENTIFIHWGNMLLHPIYSGIIIWKEDEVLFPVLSELVDDIANGERKVNRMIVIDNKNTLSISKEYIREHVMDYLYLSSKRKELYCLAEQ